MLVFTSNLITFLICLASVFVIIVAVMCMAIAIKKLWKVIRRKDKEEK